MFNSLKIKLNQITVSLKQIPKISNIPYFKPKISMTDFKSLVNQHTENLKQVKMSTITMPLTEVVKVVGKTSGQTTWILIKMFFRTRTGSFLKFGFGTFFLSCVGYTYGTVETHNVIVDKTYHKIMKGETKLIVIDKHENVYHVVNSIMWMQFNADGLFAKIKPDSKYVFRTYGAEVPIIGLHKKIINIVNEF